MSAPRVFPASAFCGLLLCLPVVAQQTAPPPPPPPANAEAPKPQDTDLPKTVIRSGVTEVIVPVTVTDDKGKFVSNLVAKDFRVLDGGRPQRITAFNHTEKQPIVVGVLIDLSNSSRI